VKFITREIAFAKLQAVAESTAIVCRKFLGA
jgi:hypothetical protein